MRNIIRLASVGIGAALSIGTIAGVAGAASPAAAPQYVGSTFTVSHATYLWDQPGGPNARSIGGKHTGAKVTSADEAAYFDNGYHSVNLSSGKTAWIYASDIVKPAPSPATHARYQVTGTVNVRNAPSTTAGAVVGTKKKGDIVSSGLYNDDFSNNGFAEVTLGNGNIGWISSAFVQ